MIFQDIPGSFQALRTNVFGLAPTNYVVEWTSHVVMAKTEKCLIRRKKQRYFKNKDTFIKFQDIQGA
jgi:hypothetical protein